MLPEEADVLSELMRRSTWERYRDEFPRGAFTSKDAKKVRASIDHLHIDSGKEVIPAKLVRRASGTDAVRLQVPLPCMASHKKLEGKLIRAGVQEHLDILDKLSDTSGVVDAEDLLQLHEFTSRVVHRGATNGARVETAESLVKRKKWGKPEFPTFLHRDMDRHFEGGVDRGDVCCLMSPYGHGKSTLLYIMSYRAALKKLKVLLISCENHEKQIARRMQQIHKRESGRRKTWPKFDVVYQNPLDIRGVRNFIEQGKYDIVVLDYYGNLDEAEVIDTTSARRTIRTLKQIAVSNNTCIWTAVQSHDPKEWQRSSQRTDLFGAKVVGQLCDCFIGVFIDTNLDRIKFTVHKRRGPGRSGVDFNGEFDVDIPRLVER